MRITYYHIASVDSTNSFAKRKKSDFSGDEFAVISAGQQTSGRGRLDKSWFSPEGKNLYVTFAFSTEKDLPPFFFSQLASLVLKEHFANLGLKAKIKWPNDILVDGKKIAGILTEVEEKDNKLFIALGIGLNVLMTREDLKHIPKNATSLLLETKKSYSLDELKEKLALSFLEKLHASKQFGIEKYQNIWKDHVSWMVGQKIQAKTYSETIEGEVMRIENDGTLVLILDNRSERVISSAEII